MKNSKSLILRSGITLMAVVALFSCSQSREEKYATELNASSLADSVSNAIQAVKKPRLPAVSHRTFVRTADLSFKVNDVKNATFDIERIVNENNGYVTSSILESSINFKNSVRVHRDSMLDILNYTVYNKITVRIPNTQLDKTLSEISGLIEYLDFRKIKADDVTRQFQAAKLSENRFINHKKRLEKGVDTKGKKLDQVVSAENELLAKQEMADDTRINTLELAHDVSYSTVSIYIYQKETTKKEIYTNTLPVEPYTPNFGSKLLLALQDGASVFGELILFFIKLWPIIFLVTGIVLFIKYILKQKWFA
jgi:hypothetical protein